MRKRINKDENSRSDSPRRFSSEKRGSENSNRRGGDRFGSRDGNSSPRSSSTGNFRDRKPFDGERKPYSGDRKPFDGERKPYSGDRKPFDGERKPYSGDRKPFDGERKPYSGDRKPFDGERKPYSGDRKPFDGERKPYSGDRKPFDGERKPYSGDRKPFDGERKPYSGDRKPFDGERKPYSGDRKPFDGERKPYSGDRKPFDGERKPYSGDRKPFDGERKPYSGDRKPFDGERKPYSGDRKPFDGERKPYSGDRKPFDGERKPYSGDRKPFDGERKPYSGDRKPFDGERSRSNRFDRPNNRYDDKRPENTSFENVPANEDGTSSEPKFSFTPRVPREEEAPRTRDGRPVKFSKKETFKSRNRFEEKPAYTPQYKLDRFKENAPARVQRVLRKEERQNDSIRLNRFIANAGICSRRDADKLIEAGEIKVNNKVITEMGYQVGPTDIVKYGNRKLNREKPVYVLLNKPKDFLTTTEDPNDRKTVMELVKNAGEARIYPVGRLDRNTTGLLLLTNDGELADKLTHPSNEVTKIYQAELDKPLSDEDFEKIVAGLQLEDGEIKVDELAKVTPDGYVIGVKIHSGKNRIVRRIFEHLGYEVTKLDRTSFAGLSKKDLPRGNWRYLTERELVKLKYFV
ncbi:pseudouridine synthase [Aquirufa sp. ROCK2-A2]